MSTIEQSIYNEVFISYSRKNVDFARKIVDAIYADGRKNVWIDWEDIEYAEDWWQKIQQGIDSAENFLFILTPDSARSQICYDEVAYAVSSGKRIIPLSYIQITQAEDFEKIHPAISQHNWLPFDQEANFDAGMAQLFKTLDTDLAHVRFHTRLQTRAREWELSELNSAYLLSTGELDEANNWLASFAQEEKIPLATDLQREYIAASQIAVNETRERERKLEERVRRTRLYLFAAIPSIIGLIITSILAVQAFIQRQEAVQRSIDSDSISNATFASFWGRDGEDPLIGLSYALEANNLDSPPVEAQVTLAELAWQPGARRQLVGHLGEIWGVAYSADGQSVFSGAGSFTGLPDNRLIQWDVSTGDIIHEFVDGHDDRIYSVATSPDGRYVATGSQDTNVVIWDLETREILHVLGDGSLEHGVPIFNVLFTHDSSRLISAGSDRIIVWDVETGAIERRVVGMHVDHILDMDISDDDQLVFSGSFDGSIRLWELDTGEIVQSMDAGQITGARFFPDETQAVTSDQDGDVIIWDLATGEIIRKIEYETAALRGGVIVTPDGERLVSADALGNVLIWELNRLSSIPSTSFHGHSGRINSIALNPESSDVATASFDRTLIVWDILGRGAEVRRFDEHTHTDRVYSAQLSPDGSQMASSTSDGEIILWDAQTGEQIRRITSSNGTIYDLSYNIDGTVLASASEDGSVSFWNPATGDFIQRYEEFSAPVRTITYSPDGNFLAAAGGQTQVSLQRPADNRIIIWNQSGEIVATLTGHDASIRALAFTPDSTKILSSSDDAQIILWDINSQELERVYSAHEDAVWSLSFNQDGTEFLSGSRDTDIIRWQTETGTILSRLSQHSSGVRALAFHPDGIHAVSGAGTLDTSASLDDFELFYWNLEEEVVLREMPGHTATIRSLVFNADGSEILSASDDGAVILWHSDTLESLITRVQENYQIVCLPDAINCENTQVLSESVDEVVVSSITGFPIQTGDLVPYAEDSACLLTQNENTPPNASVDTSIFAQEGPYVIGYSESGVDGTYNNWIRAWAEYQVDQNDDLISGFVSRNANGIAVQQKRDLQLLIDAGADALIINPIEQSEANMAEFEEEIARIVADGIPVILVGNRTFDTVYTSYVGFDPYEVGCVMAQELTALLDGEGSIGIINGYDVSVADIAFKAGEINVFGQYDGLLLTAEGPTNYSRDTAITITERQEVTGLLGYVSGITIGAQQGLSQQGFEYASFVSGHSVELARFAIENNIDGVFLRRTTQIGAFAVDAALAILQGEDMTQFVRIVPEIITIEDIDRDALAAAPDNAYLGDWVLLPETYYPED